MRRDSRIGSFAKKAALVAEVDFGRRRIRCRLGKDCRSGHATQTSSCGLFFPLLSGRMDGNGFALVRSAQNPTADSAGRGQRADLLAGSAEGALCCARAWARARALLGPELELNSRRVSAI